MTASKQDQTSDAPTTAPTERPAQLGKYEVIEEIARGSMGVVYLGHDPFADRPVAIKVALAEPLADPESGPMYRRMFFNEAHTAGSLTHPNIVSIFDAGVDGEALYIVMEHVPGGHTLKDYTRPEQLLPLETVVEMIFKCAKALDYAHGEGVVHRDIKPGNILVAPDHDVKIADFSIAHIARLEDTRTMPMGMIGSPRYMSPEQVREEIVTGQTDLFSLGVIAYELLGGRHPFAASNFSALVQRILNEPPPPLREVRPEVPEPLAAVVHKAMEKNLEDRYQTGTAFAAALSDLYVTLKGAPTLEISESERFNVLRKLSFFAAFPDAELTEILRAARWQEIGEGKEIITEGEIDDSFYILASGRVAVMKGERQLSELGPGDCFGEMGYLTRSERTATILARSDALLLKLNSTVIAQVSLNCQVRFLKVFLRTLIQRLSATTQRVSR